MRASNLKMLFLVAPGVLTFVVATGAAGQQTAPAPAPPPMPAMQVTPNTNLVSPEVHPDETVTFRLWAPDAREVKLNSEGEESVPGATQEHVMAAMKGVPMTKGADGIWSATVGPYPAGAYRYTFTLDGVSTTDPKNAASSESLTSVRSLFLIPGNFSDAKDAAWKCSRGLLRVEDARQAATDAHLSSA